MIYIFILLISLVLFQSSDELYPETIRIGLYGGEEIPGFVFIPVEGKYHVIDENRKVLKQIDTDMAAKVEYADNSIRIIVNDEDTLLVYGDFEFIGRSFKNTFIIDPEYDNLSYRIYDDNLVIQTGNNSGFVIINDVSVESYIAGVVQSESGFRRHPEFYKLQATISRTYAVKNISRHAHEGFHLCDKVHCQAYYNKSIYPDIIYSTEYTRGDIIVDEYGMPINTVYHANCGGMTMDSENVWINSTPYLKSVTDTFCLDMPGATWEKSISKEVLNDYLESELKDDFSDTLVEDIYNFSQGARKFYLDTFQLIHLGRFRNDFNLRSAYFNMIPKGDTIVIRGRGFGHGVGLCQEGAMRMAEEGISRDSIINFYYKNVSTENFSRY